MKQNTSDREIRLFISSTFKDMQEERNAIVRKIIPQIRKVCAERDVAFSFVGRTFFRGVDFFLIGIFRS